VPSIPPPRRVPQPSLNARRRAAEGRQRRLKSPARSLQAIYKPSPPWFSPVRLGIDFRRRQPCDALSGRWPFRRP
jgi:hypothetical protein